MNAAVALFRFLVATCPAEFRQNYGAQMVETFVATARCRRAENGTAEGWAFVLAAYADVLAVSLHERTSNIAKDVVYALRLIAKSWVSLAVIVATLAIAIGIGATVFSAVEAVLMTPLPYDDPDRLVFIFDRGTDTPNAHGTETSLPNTLDWLKLAQSFRGIGSFANWMPTRTGIPDPATLAGNAVTGGFFATLGIRPRLGRLLSEADAQPGAARTIVISESYWRRAFDASPSAIGRTLRLNDLAYRIVGVLPGNFAMPRTSAFGGAVADVYRALSNTASPRDSHYLTTVARLRPEVTLAAAQSDMNRVAALLRARFPTTNARLAQHVVPLEDELFGAARLMLAIALAAVAGIVAIACLNVSNILLGRVDQRERELAIRLAVGASRRRLIAQLTIENSVFAVFGGILGFGLCALLVPLLPRLGFDIPRIGEVHVSPLVALFVAGVTAACAIGIGTLPALTLRSAHIAGVLKGGGRGVSDARGKLTRSATVVFELALALTLVTGSGLLVRSFVALTAVDVGFKYEDVVASSTVILPRKRYPTADSQLGLAHALVAGLKALPDLQSAGLMVSTPLSNANYDAEGFRIMGRGPVVGRPRDVEYDAVTPGALTSLRLKLLRGRLLDERDTDGAAPVALVTKAFARENFPTTDPIGQRIVIAYGKNPPWGRRIVGVVDDFKMESLTEDPLAQVIVPLYQDMNPSFQIVGRSRAGDVVLGREISRTLRAIDHQLPARSVTAYADYLAQRRSGASTAALLLGFMAVVGLLLASIGTYGVVTYSVGRRTREFGIRRALGATAWAIASAVIRQALVLCAAGIALGFIFSLAGSSVLATLLYRVSPLDPLTFVTVAATLLLVAAAAALAPAWRATRADPVAALRHE